MVNSADRLNDSKSESILPLLSLYIMFYSEPVCQRCYFSCVLNLILLSVHLSAVHLLCVALISTGVVHNRDTVLFTASSSSSTTAFFNGKLQTVYSSHIRT